MTTALRSEKVIKKSVTFADDNLCTIYMIPPQIEEISYSSPDNPSFEICQICYDRSPPSEITPLVIDGKEWNICNGCTKYHRKYHSVWSTR